MKLTEDDFETNHEGVESWLLIHTTEDQDKLKQQIISNQEKANQWDRFNSAFRNTIDWSHIEFMLIKEVDKEPQTARMG